jgi:hypothetical protein
VTGLIDVTAEQYHDDQVADVPTLSRSIAHILCTQSPAHARHAHPKLNPAFEREEAERFDLGTAAHDLFLGGEDRVAIVNADDWRTKDAREQRDLARSDGHLPLLAKHWASVQEMHEALMHAHEAHGAEPPLFMDGKAEQTIVWDEAGGVVCRARLDWLRDDYSAVDDLKTTSRSANPESFSRSLFGSGYDIQAEFYSRGVEAVTGTRPEFRFVVVENTPPFALSVVSLGPSAMTLAKKKVDYALGVWRRCLAEDSWPSYAPRVAFAELPAWEETAWLLKEERELVA